MRDQGINILCLQETHVNTNHVELHEGHTLFFRQVFQTRTGRPDKQGKELVKLEVGAKVKQKLKEKVK